MSEDNLFIKGDKVVYPAHGVGEIIGIEEESIAGITIKLYVIFFEKDKMELKVPVNRAKNSGLRALSKKDNLNQIIAILKGKCKPSKGMWSRRAQEYEGKINSGMLSSVAEVVRDLHKNVDDPDRSYSERIIYEEALSRLAGEFAAIHEITTETASDKLKEVLKSRKIANSDTDIISKEDTAEAA